MTMKVYSVGYEYAGAQDYVKQRLDDPNVLLIDTRLWPDSWRANWTREALQQDYGKQYHWAGQFLGNLNFQGGPVKLKNPALGIKGLIMYLREGHDLILLCKCADYATCHRRVIAELLLDQVPEVEIEVYTPCPTPAPIVVEQPELLKVPEQRKWTDI